MTTFKLVLPEHLNHYGFLFGGNLLKWVDEIGWIAASVDYPGCRFVTIGMDRVEFRKGVTGGAILKLECDRVRHGTTSLSYQVEVYREPEHPPAPVEHIFSTRVTLVRVDTRGQKIRLPAPSDPPPDSRTASPSEPGK